MGRLNTVPMQRTMFDSILVVIWQMKSIKLLVFELRVILDMIFPVRFLKRFYTYSYQSA